jgi:NodT family efflux transporter outer membrane factor (OMF) lipoprotein
VGGLAAGLWVAIAAVAMLSGGCIEVGPDFKQPKVDVEANWTEQAPDTVERAGASSDPRWWTAFNDPVLTDLIETAHRNNPTLQAAGVAVLQARAQLGIAQGQIYPQQQEVGGELKYYRLDSDTFSRYDFTQQNLFIDQIALQASWEIDFWGKYARGIESDEAALQSSIAAYDDALVSLTADVANNYINIRVLEERLRVAAANVESQVESLRIAESRYRNGATSQLDVLQAETQLAQTQSQIPDLENSLAQTKYALAVQLGETPDMIEARLGPDRPLPGMPATLAVGVPKDLLRRRPDIREAEATAAAQSAAIGVAQADLYPSFSLAGTFGFGASNVGPSSLGDVFTWQAHTLNAGASFVFPIFNYGRIVNQVRVQDAAFQQAVLNYQNTVLAAQQEVEDGFSSLATSERATEFLAQAVGAARKSTELSLFQYKSGEADYTTVLSAAGAEYAVEDSLVQAQGNVLLSVVSIYRALGGGWQVRDGIGFVSDEVAQEMSERTDWGDMINEVESTGINQEEVE